LKKETTEQFEATGLPLGLFCGSHYTVRHVALEPGDSIVLYSDGITEAQNPEGGEYGEDRLIHSLRRHCDGDPATMAAGVLRDVARFRDTRPPHDDMTLLIVRRSC